MRDESALSFGGALEEPGSRSQGPDGLAQDEALSRDLHVADLGAWDERKKIRGPTEGIAATVTGSLSLGARALESAVSGAPLD